ncbi:hypothetical protein C8F04DRAFT_264873 [Mycena alexandri]|uniref:Uncharacterized protein n=1 Tax=Mycena alexandri TaxID=1745969 RepID=A0AAD6T6L7_9AGAR|nr:hypothetical protein C8F04DRAFT_264873 [Mycena alexandri]
MVQRAAGTRRAHKCIHAEYGQTESSAVCTRLDGAGVRRCKRGRGRRAKGRKEGEAGRRRARGREGDGAGMQNKRGEREVRTSHLLPGRRRSRSTNRCGLDTARVAVWALERRGWSAFDRCERVVSRHVSARASGSVCVRVRGSAGRERRRRGGQRGTVQECTTADPAGAQMRWRGRPRGNESGAGLGNRLPLSPHAGTRPTQHPRALIYPHRGQLRQRSRDLVSLPQSTATARAGCGWGAAHEGGDGEG